MKATENLMMNFDRVDFAKVATPTNGEAAEAGRVLRTLCSSLESVLFLVETAGFAPSKDIREGVNFFNEVRDFEINLIRLALLKTHGSQVRAAELLGLNTSTLNAKIKRYAIDFRESNRLTSVSAGLENC